MVNILVDKEINESDFDLVEGTFPALSQSPLHIHTKYSETIYVLEGELTLYLPSVEKTIKAGETAFIPANTPHTLVNASDKDRFKALVVAHPGGFAKLIRAVGIPVDDPENPGSQQHDMQLAAKVMEEVGDKILGPPGARP